MAAGPNGFLYPSLGPQGGVLCNVPVLISDQLADDEVLLVDASRIVAASDVIVIDSVRHASLAMDSAPDGLPAVVSLWQRNLLGMKAERLFSFAPAEPEGYAALVSGAQWGTTP